MKKKGLSFHYITLSVICQLVFGFCGFFGAFVSAEEEIAPEKIENIRIYCSDIQEYLKRIQKEDAIIRTHIGPYYNNILEKFMKPLNLRLVENNMAISSFFNNQSSFATTQDSFREDYSAYQKSLSELIIVDCKNEPEKFYKQLEDSRAKRKAVKEDVMKMRNLVSGQTTQIEGLVKELKNKRQEQNE